MYALTNTKLGEIAHRLVTVHWSEGSLVRIKGQWSEGSLTGSNGVECRFREHSEQEFFCLCTH